jgi:hypothetical protein
VLVRNLIKFAACFVLGLGAVALLGCADDTDNDNSDATTEIKEIDADDTTIQVGDGTVVRFDFVFDEEDVFENDAQVQLVVKLPNELVFQNSSAKIDGFNSQNDDGVSPQIVRCNGGVSYLVFNLDQYDLDNASPPTSDTDAQLKMTINGRLTGTGLVIEARAEEGDVSYGCDKDFYPDEQQVVAVVD